MRLQLLEKRVSANKTMYRVVLDGTERVLSSEQMIYCINNIDSKQRDCKVVNGKVYRKPSASKQQIDNSIQIITKLDSRNTKKHIINSCDAFATKVFKYKSFILANGYLIEQIDNSKIVNKDTLEIVGKHGITSINTISTGCKACIIVKFLISIGKIQNYIIRVDECGDNALEVIFDIIANSEIKPILLLSYPAYALLDVIEKYKFIIDDKPVNDETSYFKLYETGENV